MSDLVLCEIKKSTAWVTVNRPEARNAASNDVIRMLTTIFLGLHHETRARVIVLRGAGEKTFIAGADLKEFLATVKGPQEAIRYDDEHERLQQAIIGAPQPVIAMIHGHAPGTGTLLALASDFRFASSDAQLSIPVSSIGLLAPAPDTLRLIDLVGMAKAKDILITGRRLGAEEALRIGLVDRVVDAKDLVGTTTEFADSLTENSGVAIQSIKEVFKDAMLKRLDSASVRAAYYRVYESADMREGIEAVMNKRRPTYTGTVRRG